MLFLTSGEKSASKLEEKWSFIYMYWYLLFSPFQCPLCFKLLSLSCFSFSIEFNFSQFFPKKPNLLGELEEKENDIRNRETEKDGC